MKKTLQILIIICGIVGVGIEFYTMEFIRTPYTNWDGIRIFNYFTLQSNLIVVVYFLVMSMRKKSLSNDNFSRYIGSVTLSITLTFSLFAIFLQSTWNPQGLAFYSSILLHYVTPILTILYFVRYFKEFQFRRNDFLIWMIYPILYVIFALIRGSITGDYLYPFLDLNVLSPVEVGLFILLISLIYLTLSKLIIHINNKNKQSKKALFMKK